MRRWLRGWMRVSDEPAMPLISLALVPFLAGRGESGPVDLPDYCPADLRAWLAHCNGLLLADGTWLLGWGPHLDDLLRIEGVFVNYPGFAERQWWPIACDGCGNYWVLNGYGVWFVDCAESYERAAYLVASTLDRFLVPFLLPFLDRRGWPFERDTVAAWDPRVLSSDHTKAWD